MPTSIIATGRAFPKRAVSNAALSRRLGIGEDEIRKKTGILNRYWAEAGETSATLAIQASQSALQSAGLRPGDLDLILVTTTTPDFYFPSTACLVQKGLLARPVPAFDINGSCSGFLYGLSIADQYLRNGSAKKVLLVSSDVKSRSIDPNDPSTAILFGDGAGAVILSLEVIGIQNIHIASDGAFHRLIQLPTGGSRQAYTPEAIRTGKHFMKMSGQKVFRKAIITMERAFHAFLAANALSLDQIDHFIFHQANLRILESLRKRNAIPQHKIHLTLIEYGNTSSSSVPIALDVAYEEGRLKRGDRLLLSVFGGGITWGNALIEWHLPARK